MSETIKIEIEIPAPPEGWGEVEYRSVSHEEIHVKFWDGSCWFNSDGLKTKFHYPVARKLAPLWTPPPEWHALLGNCWLTRNINDDLRVHKTKPDKLMGEGVWECDDYEFYIPTIRPELCPPDDIPWYKCCFKIGEPDE